MVQLRLLVTAEDLLRYTRAAKALRISRSELFRRGAELVITAPHDKSEHAHG